MKHVAVVGGGIAGLSAAYELELLRRGGAPADYTLFEASKRLGGIVDTERSDGFVVELGPDSWVTEKPWARELAVELGLESELVFSQDDRRKTWLARDGALHPLPDGMRMIAPVEWAGILESPLLSAEAKRAYQREPKRAAGLKAAALDASDLPHDESVRDFVIRHFGEEVADTFAAPLLAGIFGGEIAKLSVRATLPAYVALEREYGSIILGLQSHRTAGKPEVPLFTTLRCGLATLVEKLESQIPAGKIRCGTAVAAAERNGKGWRLSIGPEQHTPGRSLQQKTEVQFDAVILATPAAVTERMLAPLDARAADLLPSEFSSAIVVALAYSPEQARSLKIPTGFGFLVPQADGNSRSAHDYAPSELARRALLACTFGDQKFPGRVPLGGRLLRAFFGGPFAPALLMETDHTLAKLTCAALSEFLGNMPAPKFARVQRWPRSLPLYSVGHLDRMAELDRRMAQLPAIRLIGNAYRGVGLPDLVRQGRAAARDLAASLLNQ
jgi:oxygen-dependent protoporphyrinogen oxidase